MTVQELGHSGNECETVMLAQSASSRFLGGRGDNTNTLLLLHTLPVGRHDGSEELGHGRNQCEPVVLPERQQQVLGGRGG
jgi:hypothetical protein